MGGFSGFRNNGITEFRNNEKGEKAENRNKLEKNLLRILDILEEESRGGDAVTS